MTRSQRRWGIWAVFGSAIFLNMVAAAHLHWSPGGVNLSWPAAALSAAMMLLLGHRLWASARIERQDAELRWFYENQLVGQGGTVGEDYLWALTQHTASCFGADYVVVSELQPDGRTLRTAAAWAKGGAAPAATYTLANTPCEQVLANGLCVYPTGVRETFAAAPLLAELGVDSFIGVPILGDSSQPLGVLTIMHTAPLPPLTGHMVALLGIFASRVAAEMQQLRAERALRASQQLYHDLVEQASAIIVRWVPDGRLTFANNFALRFFGYEAEELLGQPLIGTIIPPVDEAGTDLERMLDAIAVDPERYATNQNENMRRDGTRVWVAWSNVAVYDEDGDIIEFVSVGFDMTALRQAEAEVRANAERVRATLDMSPFGAIVFELDGDDNLRVVGYSRAASQILGADLSAMRGLTLEEAFPPLAATDIPAIGRRLASEGGTWVDPQVPYAHGNVAGSYQCYAYQTEPRHVAVMFHETSERDLIQAKLYRRNREVNLLNRIISTSSAEMDPSAVLRLACEELADVLDMPYAAAAIVDERELNLQFLADCRPAGEPSLVRRLLPLADIPTLAAAWSRGEPLCAWNAGQMAATMDPAVLALRSAECCVALPLMVEGEAVGCLFLLDIAPRELPDDDMALAWGVAQQLASALARSRLTASRRHLAVAIEQTPDSIVVTDPQGYIQYVNPSFETITGYGAAEVIGRSTRILKSGLHDESHYQHLWQTITAGRVWEGRLINRKRDGNTFTESAVIAPVRDETGAIINYIAVKRDMTDELEREEHYRQAQKMESIGRLAGGIAHDFNNILTAMIGHAESADEMLGARHPAREEIAGVLAASQRAASLTRQLLAFARRQVVQPVVFDLGGMASGLSNMLRRLIGEDIDLRVAASPDELPVLADAGQMEQVLVNLTVNARDAMPNGGSLVVRASRDGDSARLSVTDTGTGIPAHVLPRIFDPFFTTKPEGQGTGLGLATCYGIVQQAGGEITCDSEIGRGTTFTIRLPLANGATAEAQGDDVEPSRGTETVLMVEDEQSVRTIASRLLQGLGYTVIEAASGMEALDLASRYEGPIHLLISDMVMPEMNGLALANALAEKRPDTKLLLITGYIGDQAFQDAEAFAARPHLHKPFTRGELAEKIRDVLD
ncbi:MAG: PAS domain S-box protein [Armatimonadetes bacterium]|nr:PAS domain S-box protein [Armatimonadota bacterium]